MIHSHTDSGDTSSDRLAPLGRVLFTAGIILIVARGLSMRLPGFPAFWYANQPLWLTVGFGMTALGWIILWRFPHHREAPWSPVVPGVRFRTAVLYVSEGCHLCDDAAALLTHYQKWIPNVEEIDIRTDPKLVEQFGTCVPVVVLDGKVRFRGRVEEVLLRRLIEGTPSVD